MSIEDRIKVVTKMIDVEVQLLQFIVDNLDHVVWVYNDPKGIGVMALLLIQLSMVIVGDIKFLIGKMGM